MRERERGEGWHVAGVGGGARRVGGVWGGGWEGQKGERVVGPGGCGCRGGWVEISFFYSLGGGAGGKKIGSGFGGLEVGGGFSAEKWYWGWSKPFIIEIKFWLFIHTRNDLHVQSIMYSRVCTTLSLIPDWKLQSMKLPQSFLELIFWWLGAFTF